MGCTLSLQEARRLQRQIKEECGPTRGGVRSILYFCIVHNGASRAEWGSPWHLETHGGRFPVGASKTTHPLELQSPVRETLSARIPPSSFSFVFCDSIPLTPQPDITTLRGQTGPRDFQSRLKGGLTPSRSGSFMVCGLCLRMARPPSPTRPQ